MNTTLNPSKKLVIVLMAALIILTRGNWSFTHLLPDATFAALLISGAYYRSFDLALGFTILAVAIDWYVTSVGLVSPVCLTLGYWTLILSYFVIYFAGTSMGSLVFTQHNAVRLTLIIFVAICIQWTIASAGFYWLSGYFQALSLAGFVDRIMLYAPGEIAGALFWIAIFSLVATLRPQAFSRLVG